MDSKQKRMSAMHPAAPWRGPLVDASETGFNAGNRRAAMFLYSLISAVSPGGGGSLDKRVFDLTPIEIVYRTEDERQSILPLLAAILSDEL